MRLVLLQRAVLRPPPIKRLLRNPELLADLRDRLTLPLQLLGLAKLRHDLLRRVTLTRHLHPYPSSQHSRHSHTNWTDVGGTGQGQYLIYLNEHTEATTTLLVPSTLRKPELPREFHAFLEQFATELGGRPAAG